MKRAFRAFVTCCGIIIVAFQYYGCGSSIELAAHKTDHPITIDGKSDEWKGISNYIEKQKVSVGFMEDQSSLYVLLVTNDRQTESQILGAGLTVWFDSTGSDNKTLGIHFPIGSMDRGERPTMEKSDQQESKSQEPGQQMEGMLDKVNGQMEIIGPEKDQTSRVLLPSSNGYDAKVGMDQGRLVCELKIPLVTGNDKGIAGVGFETPEMDKSKMSQSGEGEGPGGGGPPSGGGMPSGGGGGMGEGGGPPGGGGGPGGGGPGGGGPGGGGPGGSSSSQSTPLDLWIHLRLTSAGEQGK